MGCCERVDLLWPAPLLRPFGNDVRQDSVKTDRAENQARIEAIPSVSIVKERRAMECAAGSSIVYVRYIGASGATSRTRARIWGAI